MWQAVGLTLLGLIGMGVLIVGFRMGHAYRCGCVVCAQRLQEWRAHKVSETVRLMIAGKS